MKREQPKWKQRAAQAKFELEAAQRAERYRQFWQAVPPLKPAKSIDYERLPV